MVPVQLDFMAYVPNTPRRLPTVPFSLMVSFPARVPFPSVAIWPTAVIGLPLAVPFIVNPYLPVKLPIEQAAGRTGSAQRDMPSASVDRLRTAKRTSLDFIFSSLFAVPYVRLQFSSHREICQGERVCNCAIAQ